MKTYKNSHTLRTHKVIHHNPKAEKHKCPYCDYKTTRSHDMKRHKMKHEEKFPSYQNMWKFFIYKCLVLKLNLIATFSNLILDLFQIIYLVHHKFYIRICNFVNICQQNFDTSFSWFLQIEWNVNYVWKPTKTQSL